MPVTLITKKIAHDPLLSREEAAEFLGISTRSLDRYAALRCGPDRTRIGRKVVKFRRSALEAWLTANTEVGTVA